VIASELPALHASPINADAVGFEKFVKLIVSGFARIHLFIPIPSSKFVSNIIPLVTEVIEKSAYPV
jgi:hypothetical protein